MRCFHHPSQDGRWEVSYVYPVLPSKQKISIQKEESISKRIIFVSSNPKRSRCVLRKGLTRTNPIVGMGLGPSILFQGGVWILREPSFLRGEVLIFRGKEKGFPILKPSRGNLRASLPLCEELGGLRVEAPCFFRKGLGDKKSVSIEGK